jgi:hypothetical protein
MSFDRWHFLVMQAGRSRPIGYDQDRSIWAVPGGLAGHKLT